MSNQKGFTLVGMIYVIIILFVIGGWIANIAKLLGMEDPFVAEGILRIVGIFLGPLGVVMGYL